MLTKKPEKRITIEKIKQHQFFKDLDFQKLFNKQIQPPNLTAQYEELKVDPEEENQGDEQHFKEENHYQFTDQDYTLENYRKNRLKNFTFITG